MIKRFSIILCLAILSFSCSKEDNTIIDKPTSPVDPTPPVVVPPIGNDKDIPDPKTFKIPSEYSDYYKSIDWSKKGMELKKELAKLITQTHHPIPYTPGVWEAIEYTDQDPDNPNNVLLIYGWPDKDAKNVIHKRSMHKTSKSSGNGSNRDYSWEREHVFAKSLAVVKNTKQTALIANVKSNYIGTSIPEIAGTDVHNLRSINGTWNNTRGNKKFADGHGNSGPVGSYNWYPGDDWKGDVARMMLYMHIRYESNKNEPDFDRYTNASKVGIPINSRAPLTDSMIDLFLKWNAEDPVDEIERRRNEYHGNPQNPEFRYAQGNRNPFIDNPSLANVIWGMPIYIAENTWK
ncbi:endonuclease [Myroides odoratimimus]|uniref:endonuclease I family protein n=1 Tax=Myroides odoratimimus TaxID=76832 RepID=UPI00103DE2EC|nr:endonuclease [Myroides odoratimimus]MDM1496712.1 endonuclease [Myroides odoratimimus]MDM1529137.1 endonuclease [Myroides odoratimimus]QBK76682.1 endonuclease [Myroides odoratimimus]